MQRLTYAIAVARAHQSDKFHSWGRRRAAGKPIQPFEERHYTPSELAPLWGLSVDTIRMLFKHEKGVMRVGSKGSRRRRGYITMRIPQSVVERVHTRLSGEALGE